MAKLTLYEIQSYVHHRGFKCGGRIEGKGTGQMWRLILYRNGKEYKVGELIRFSEMPKAYAEKYTALYEYLINSAKSELSNELNEIIQTSI
jgi:hypothetical protein